jgi:hypothetical protein
MTSEEETWGLPKEEPPVGIEDLTQPEIDDDMI